MAEQGGSDNQDCSYRDRIEAEQIITEAIQIADSGKGKMEMFSLRIPDPSPGLVAQLEKTATELQEAAGCEAPTLGEDSHIRRIKHVFGATGLLKTEIAIELKAREENLFRWIKPRNKGGTAPGYRYLERLSRLARRLGIPGSLLDDSCCLPMTVETFGKAPASGGALVTFSNAAIRQLKERSPSRSAG